MLLLLFDCSAVADRVVAVYQVWTLLLICFAWCVVSANGAAVYQMRTTGTATTATTYHDDGDVEDLEESEVKTGLSAMVDSSCAALIPPPSRVAAVASASSTAQGAGGHDFGRLNPAAI